MHLAERERDKRVLISRSSKRKKLKTTMNQTQSTKAKHDSADDEVMLNVLRCQLTY